MSIPLYPLTFEPVYKDYVWGGQRMRTVLGRPLPPGVYAEAWELADRPEGMSRVKAGPLAGTTLGELVQRAGTHLTGIAAPRGPFPLILKILDVAQRASLQVHPRSSDPWASEARDSCGDRLPSRGRGEAKTELWYALDGMEDGRIFAGLNPGVLQADFEDALRRKQVETVLRSLPVRPGDAFYIPGGRVHAIDQGCLFLEIQQNSNTTYRVYDWDRHDARALHVDEAFRTIDWQDHESARVLPSLLSGEEGLERWLIHECPYFRVERWSLSTRRSAGAERCSFRLLFVLAGRILVSGGGEEAMLNAGETCLLPAALDAWCLVPDGDRPTGSGAPPVAAEFLLITL
ncbi:MAG: type I phosphomannose isomerase catalytic subunit [Candidatus Eisenbacteria bacterium]